MSKPPRSTKDGYNVIDLIVDILEVQQQAEHDLCGEQREWHLPRLRRAVLHLIEMFPSESALAAECSQSPV